MIERANIANIYRLSPLQGGMLFHALYDAEGNSYFEQGVYSIEGKVDPVLFEKAWNLLAERHDALRTAFLHRDVPEPLQVVLRTRPVPFLFEDLSDLEESDRESAVLHYRARTKRKGFDLARDPLLSIGLFRIAPGRHVMVMSFHHIIMDGWCQSILASELGATYRALLQGVRPGLPAVGQYREYVRWLEERKSRGVDESGMIFWERYLGDFSSPTPFPTRGGEERRDRQIVAGMQLSSRDTDALDKRIRTSGWTLNSVVQGLVGILLGRLNGAEDAVFLATVSGRPEDLPGAGAIVGLFINTLPVRVRAPRSLRVGELFTRLRTEAGDAQPWQTSPLAEIQGRTPLRNRLANTLLVVENFPEVDSDEDLPFRFTQLAIDEQTNYDLTIQVHPGKRLAFTFAFPADRIDPQLVADAKEWLRNSLRLVAGEGDGLVGDLFAEGPLNWRPDESILPSEHDFTRFIPDTKGKLSVHISATFTADPIVSPLQWWIRQMGYDPEVTLSHYNQVFQDLLDPNSSLRTAPGFATLLVRFDDWIRDVRGGSDREVCDHLLRVYREYVDAIESFDGEGVLIHVIPPADRSNYPAAVREQIDRLETEILKELSGRTSVAVVDCRGAESLYHVAEPFDPVAHEAGDVPYTPEMNRVIATMIARRLLSRTQHQFKVIAVDCDNTLWEGVCGEEGPSGVVVRRPHRLLQEFLIDRYREGFLIALCSKNNSADVDEVFAVNDGMILRPEHIVDRRVNWRPKSENLRELAEDLNLGPDSFVFIDDSPMEVAEVRRNAPEIFSLQFPSDPAGVEQMIHHLWGLDRWAVTAEDRERGRMYATDLKRKSVRASASSLEEFLAGLDIRVTMSPVADHEVARMAQLTQRTNQFNVSTRRRSDGEIRGLLEDEITHCWTVSVEDRFGAYGIVGLIIGSRVGDSLVVDTFLLSCRVLGRGVETSILMGLRAWGAEQGLLTIEVPYIPTQRNAPARQFLETWPGSPSELEGVDGGLVFRHTINEPLQLHSTATLTMMSEPNTSGKSESDSAASDDEVTSVGQKSDVPDSSDGNHEPESRSNDSVALSLQIDPDEIISSPHAHLYVPLILSDARSLGVIAGGVAPHDSRPDVSDGPYVRPVTPEEIRITDVFAEVLRVDRVGLSDDFFSLGGNSLTAVELLSKLHREFGNGISLPLIFENPRPGDLLEVVRSGDVDRWEPIPRIPESEYYPLSYAQQRLRILDDLGVPGDSYVMGGCTLLTGSIDPDALEHAYLRVIERHESLRTGFPTVDRDPVQKIYDSTDFRIERIDLRPFSMTGEEERRVIDRLTGERRSKPFNLEVPPLIRVSLIRLSDDRSVLLQLFHHIVADGWSYPILVREVLSHYRQGVELKGAGDGLLRTPGQTAPTDATLPLPAVRYCDYAVWQHDQIEQGVWQESESFWHEHLAAPRPQLDLPTDFPRPDYPDGRGGSVVVEISPERMARLEEVCSRERTTLFMTLLAAVRLLMWRLTGERETILGVPIAGRDHPDLENLIGFFVNTLPLRQGIDPEATISELLQGTRQCVLQGLSHRMIPLDRIIGRLDDLDRNSSRSPLFDVAVVLQNNREAEIDLDGLHVEPWGEDAGAGKFDLVFNFSLGESGGGCSLEYRSDLFSAETVQGWGTALLEVVDILTDRPETIPLERLGLFQQVHREAERIASLNLPEGSLLESFETIARSYPDTVAVVDADGEWTYGELLRTVDSTADRIRRLGVRRGEIMAALLDRGYQLVSTILGVMKSGAIYMPIDPTTPTERIRDLVRRSRCVAVLSSDVEDLPSNLPVPVCSINRPAEYDPDSLSLNRGGDDSDGAVEDGLYVIYTSGSTGEPKGVIVQENAFRNMISEQISTFDVGPTDRVLQFASPAFDASLSEIFMSLLSGATLVVPDRSVVQDPGAFLLSLRTEKVSVATLPPLYLRALGPVPLDPLRVLITAGEEAPKEIVDYHSARRDMRVFNAYGPTESAVCATIFPVRGDSGAYSIPIGQTIRGVGAFVADDRMLPLPDGVPGELVLFGTGLAAGYLHDRDLTDEKFIHPHWAPELRCYRTGDVVRRDGSGCFTFVGRRDSQVKIRGHRVEPEELRRKLLTLRAVGDAVVLVRPAAYSSGAFVESELLAWVTPGADMQRPDGDAIRRTIESMLPSYLVPTSIYVLDVIPTTLNGKIDTDALFLHAGHRPTTSEERSEGEGPSDVAEVEEVIIDVVAKLLGRANVSPADNFFALGGDSLKAIRLGRLLAEQGLSVAVREIYDRQDLRSLARSIVESRQVSRHEVRREVSGPIPLTPIQRWAVASVPREEFAGMSLSLVAEAREVVDVSLAEETLHRLARTHDALRTTAEWTGPNDLQLRIAEEPLRVKVDTIELDRFDSDVPGEMSDDLSHAIRALESGFVLDGEHPMLRAAIVRERSGMEMLVISVHHLVIDAVSVDLLLGDLNRLYAALRDGSTTETGAATTSWGEWAFQVAAQSSELSPTESDHWRNVVESIRPIPALRRNPAMDDRRASGPTSRIVTCPAELASRIRAIESDGVGAPHILLAALQRTIEPLLDEGRPLPVMIEGHGRLSRDAMDIGGTIGWFTTLYPIVLPSDGSSAERALRIRDAIDSIGFDTPTYLRLATDPRHPEISLDARPEITFNFLGDHSGSPSDDAVSDSGQTFRYTGLNSTLGSLSLSTIEINALIEEGELRVIVATNGDADPDVITHLQESLVSSIDEVVSAVENRNRPTTRIIALPSIGGVPGEYDPLRRWLPPDVELLAVETAGHGRRIAEGPATTVAAIVRDVVEEIRHSLDLPFVFYGHSFGGLLLRETLIELRRCRLPLPVGIVVSAMAAPRVAALGVADSRVPDEGLLRSLFSEVATRVGRTPADFIERSIAGAYADLKALDSYAWTAVEPFDIPMTLMYGSEDDIPLSDILEWSYETSGEVRLVEIDGNHNLVGTSPEAIVPSILDIFARPTSVLIDRATEVGEAVGRKSGWTGKGYGTHSAAGSHEAIGAHTSRVPEQETS